MPLAVRHEFSRIVTTNILTFEVISYQAKGEWFGSGRQAAIQMQEVYAGGLPLPSGRMA